jgi:uncharacterized protein (DUF2147 family)
MDWMRAIAFALYLLAVAATACAAREVTASGVWQQVDDASGEVGALIAIYERNGRFEGRISKLFPKPGEPANPICSKCKGRRKDKPYLGLEIIEDLERDGLSYAGGKILDPETGAEFDVELELSPDGQRLTVRGFVGFSPLGRSQEWKRVM